VVEVAAPAGSPVVDSAAPAPDESSLPSRWELWTAAIRLGRRHPVLGMGPDAFRHHYGEVIAPAGGGRFVDDRLHANNLYFETVADLGLVGLASLAFLLYALGRHARDRWHSAAGMNAWSLVALAAAATYFIHGAIDTFLTFTPTLVLLWLLVALGSRSEARA